MQHQTPLFTRRRPTVRWWLAFAGVQAIGFILPLFANIHSNPTPFFIGILVLLPGSLASLVLPEGLPVIIQCGLISGMNLIVWLWWWRARQSGVSDQPS